MLDSGIEEDLRLRHLQVADATRASLGLPVVEYIVTCSSGSAHSVLILVLVVVIVSIINCLHNLTLGTPIFWCRSRHGLIPGVGSRRGVLVTLILF